MLARCHQQIQVVANLVFSISSFSSKIEATHSTSTSHCKTGQSENISKVVLCVHSNTNVYSHRRAKAAKAPPAEEDGEETPSPHIPAGPKQDYSLKEGQTFSIKIPGSGQGRKIRDSNTSNGSGSAGLGGFGGGILPPPPSRRK